MSTHQSLDSIAGAAPDGGGNAPPARLTAKEKQTLMWCFKGKTSWEIARIQNCSEATVNFHFSNIRRKFAVSSRSAALLKAIESGVIRIDETGERGAHESD
ncbi:helix-turn-helix domain-containing protein [Pseudomonas sp. SDO5532_S415]|jgi:DNA-binding CsgD family transcriptional regulator|uniref:helix-turn-helix domain-containing protein n=1 Tax=Pseudomonas sp. Irchel 3A7 TaxID=2008913 RepID=UPI000BA35726|nr:helix-turn-helix domain-containing protein [Pseudomonas sp. Irchel 3A7]